MSEWPGHSDALQGPPSWWLFLQLCWRRCRTDTLSLDHTKHFDCYSWNPPPPSLPASIPHTPALFRFIYRFFTLFYLGARIWWRVSKRNNSQWRSRKTRLPPFLWVCPLQSLCRRGKDSTPKHIAVPVALLWASQYKQKWTFSWELTSVASFLIMLFTGFLWFVFCAYQHIMRLKWFYTKYALVSEKSSFQSPADIKSCNCVF